MRDIVIIGSGPAGLSAALYAKRANLDVLVVEKEFQGIGQIAESAQVDNYIGLCGISGFDLGEKFRSDAEKFDAEFYEGNALKIELQNGVWHTFFENEIIKSRTVIYAAGATHRKLNVPGEERLIGRGVSFCAVCDGALYRGKTVAVIGGGDTALDDALYLSDIAEKVYLIHRRTKFRGSEKSVLKIKSKENIEIVTPANVLGICGENRINSIKLDNGRELALNGIFVAIGMSPATDLVKNIVTLDSGGYIRADETGITDAPGFFAAGDVRTKKLRQVVTAVSDGANAAFSAIEYLKKI
ncbi:MAG: FAD-dependent oxidoreductase [Bacteroides sp.]|nr:FAD-dependent oxidoreductase [Eubacterium sp.]MCM1418212.1 FAD-dependent oxidoreductase [Roseburia sp.]MCM1462763.1 FAD-dependent oxidoreductase [Bacteroides sp.]